MYGSTDHRQLRSDFIKRGLKYDFSKSPEAHLLISKRNADTQVPVSSDLTNQLQDALSSMLNERRGKDLSGYIYKEESQPTQTISSDKNTPHQGVGNDTENLTYRRRENIDKTPRQLIQDYLGSISPPHSTDDSDEAQSVDSTPPLIALPLPTTSPNTGSGEVTPCSACNSDDDQKSTEITTGEIPNDKVVNDSDSIVRDRRKDEIQVTGRDRSVSRQTDSVVNQTQETLSVDSLEGTGVRYGLSGNDDGTQGFDVIKVVDDEPQDYDIRNKISYRQSDVKGEQDRATKGKSEVDRGTDEDIVNHRNILLGSADNTVLDVSDKILDKSEELNDGFLDFERDTEAEDRDLYATYTSVERPETLHTRRIVNEVQGVRTDITGSDIPSDKYNSDRDHQEGNPACACKTCDWNLSSPEAGCNANGQANKKPLADSVQSLRDNRESDSTGGQ